MLKFEEKKASEKIGKIVGYVVMYFVFTTILYFVLMFLEKIPESWNYFHVMAITLLIIAVGKLIKELLK